MRKLLLLLLVLVIGALFITGCARDTRPTPAGPGVASTAGATLAFIKSLEIQPLEESVDQIELLITGNLTDNCTVVAEPLIKLEGNEFILTIPSTQNIEGDCVPTKIPFEQKITLETQDLPPGSYTVTLGDQQTRFELPGTVLSVAATPSPQAPQTTDQSGPATETAATREGESETTALETDIGHITGLVWHDRCTADESTTVESGTLPPGCIPLNGGIQANGILEADEPGLGGVRLELGAGPCPAVGLDSQISAADGTFAFSVLVPGTYCVSIEAQAPGNEELLQPGNWTSPGQTAGKATLNLATGEPLPTVNFGWDLAPQSASLEVGCFEKAAFFEDVTVPDDTVFRPGVSFVKTWRIRNEGSCPWGPDYDLIFSHGDQLAGPSSTPLPSVAPGEIANLSADLKAPASGGTYVGNWQLRNPDGLPFGVGINGNDFFWVQIAVSWFPSPDQPPVSPPASTPPPPPPQLPVKSPSTSAMKAKCCPFLTRPAQARLTSP